MRNLAATVMTLICLGGRSLMAADDPRTLPPEMYQAMWSGSGLEKVFVDPAYDRTKGFKLGSVEYRAETKISAVFDALNKSMKMLTRNDSPFTLNLAVTRITPGYKLIRTRVRGRLTVEGVIVDGKGKILAAFITKEPTGKIGSDLDDYQFACDAIATAISKDLL
jgi:hypothetical protein